MSFEVRFDRNAEREIARAVAYYDKHAPEQSERFIGEVVAMSRWVGENPLLPRQVRPGVHLVSLRVFPYRLWYRVFEEVSLAEVFALLHRRQDPTTALDRL